MIRFIRRRRESIAMSTAVAVPVAVCSALIPVRATFENTDAALVLVAFTVAVAALGNRMAGYLAAAGAAMWFNFFLTEPYEQLAITHRADLQTTVLLLVVGIAATELAVAARRRGRTVAVDEALLAVVQSTAGLVARGEPAHEVIDQVSVQIKAVLGLRACRFEPGPVHVGGLRLKPDGTLRWGAARWNLEEHGFPDETVDLPARHRGTVYGRFILQPTPAVAPSIHARRIAVVVADLAAATLAEDHSPARDQ